MALRGTHRTITNEEHEQGLKKKKTELGSGSGSGKSGPDLESWVSVFFFNPILPAPFLSSSFLLPPSPSLISPHLYLPSSNPFTLSKNSSPISLQPKPKPQPPSQTLTSNPRGSREEGDEGAKVGKGKPSPSVLFTSHMCNLVWLHRNWILPSLSRLG